MTYYFVACAASAPALLLALLVSASWIVGQATQIRHLDTELHQRDAEIEQLSTALVGRGRTCVELGRCASALTSDHADRAGR